MSQSKLKQLLDIGDVDLTKHIPEIDKGYNAGIELSDGSYTSVPGKTLEEAINNLCEDYHVKHMLRDYKGD